MRLTKAAIDSAEPRAKKYYLPDHELPGKHYILVHPSGGKVHLLQYRTRTTRKQRWHRLGKVGEITLAQARTLARQALGVVASGGDPAGERQAKRQMAKSPEEDPRFQAVRERYLAHCAARALRPDTLKSYGHVLRGAVPPSWRKRPVGDFTRADHMRLLDSLIAEGKVSMARLTNVVLTTFWNWCVTRSLITTSPAQGVKLEVMPRPRERALTLDELRCVWQAASAMEGAAAAVIVTLLLTGQRLGETRQMRWQDVDLDGPSPMWTIPATTTKNGRQHLVPLSGPLVLLIKSLKRLGDHVFTASGRLPIAAERVHAARTAIAKTLPDIEHFTPHDLRRSVVTGLHEHGLADPHTIELIVNHIGGLRGGIAGIYDRSLKLAERRRALDAWAKLVTQPEIVGSNVLSMRA